MAPLFQEGTNKTNRFLQFLYRTITSTERYSRHFRSSANVLMSFDVTELQTEAGGVASNHVGAEILHKIRRTNVYRESTGTWCFQYHGIQRGYTRYRVVPLKAFSVVR